MYKAHRHPCHPENEQISGYHNSPPRAQHMPRADHQKKKKEKMLLNNPGENLTKIPSSHCNKILASARRIIT